MKKHRSLTANLLFVLVCAAPAAWFIYDRAMTIVNSELEGATIVNCDYKKSGRITSRGRKATTSYTPIAVSEEGHRVKGTFWWSSRKMCEKTLNTNVSVFIHNLNPEKNRINTFFQLWFFPAISVYFAMLVAILVLFHVPWAGTSLTAIFVAMTAVGYFKEVHFPEKPAIGFEGEGLSKAALDRCVKEVMAKQGIPERAEVKRLLCQNAGITDLSSISDLVYLEELYLQGNRLTSLETIGDLKKLKTISVAKNEMVSLKGIERLTGIEELQANTNKISDLEGLGNLKNLRVVGLMNNNIENISEFSGLTKLEDVTLSRNKITDINPLTNKPLLKEIQLYWNNVKDISSLYGNTNMKIVGIRGDGKVPCEQIREMRSRLSADAKVWGQEGC